MPTILFVCTNGAGMGHLSRCLSYARQLQGRAEIIFFSMASAIDIIEEMGFAAEYFVSPNWSGASSFEWNRELCYRLGLMLEHVRLAVIVFDGTWPYQGLFMGACREWRARRSGSLSSTALCATPIVAALDTLNSKIKCK